MIFEDREKIQFHLQGLKDMILNLCLQMTLSLLKILLNCK